MCEIEFRVPEFNQWPLNRESRTKFSMEKARGTSQQGPQNEGTTQSKVTIFLGHEEAAKEFKKKARKLDEMHHELNKSGQLRDTVKLILEHFR